MKKENSLQLEESVGLLSD